MAEKESARVTSLRKRKVSNCRFFLYFIIPSYFCDDSGVTERAVVQLDGSILVIDVRGNYVHIQEKNVRLQDSY
jgi:very-short-patch-repair endonuclease